MGDCDTKSIYLFAILKKLGYDVAILVSDFYQHAILGIALPGRGDYIKYQGKKYLKRLLLKSETDVPVVGKASCLGVGRNISLTGSSTPLLNGRGEGGVCFKKTPSGSTVKKGTFGLLIRRVFYLNVVKSFRF